MFCLSYKMRAKWEKALTAQNIMKLYGNLSVLVPSGLEVETTGLAGHKGCQEMPVIRMDDKVQSWFETLKINYIHTPFLYLFP